MVAAVPWVADSSCRVTSRGWILAALSDGQDLQEAEHDERRDVLGSCCCCGRHDSVSAGNRQLYSTVIQMRRSVVIISVLVLIAGALAWQRFGSRRRPQGQPPLTNLTESSFPDFEKSFDDASQQVRVLALLSPT